MSQTDELFRTSSDCAESQSSHIQEMEEDCRPSSRKEQAPVHEEQCDSTDVSVDSDINAQSGCGDKMNLSNKIIKLKDEHLDLQCQWRGCDYRTCLLDHFVLHVSFHVSHTKNKLNESQKGTSSLGFLRSSLFL
jgi:hypothetical protein